MDKKETGMGRYHSITAKAIIHLLPIYFLPIIPLCRYASACVRPRGLSGDRLVAAPCSVRAPRLTPAPACIS